MKSKIFIWPIIFLILINTVLALGIRPAKTNFNFEPNTEKEFSFNIVNNEKRALEIQLSAEGSLKEYIIFDEKEISISEKEEFRAVKFKLDLPPSLTPGLNTGEIVVTEIPETGGTASASLQLSHKLNVIAPYPEKYVEADIKLRIREKESDVITEIRNSGSQKIDELTTRISVYDNEKKLKELQTEPILLEPTQTKQYYLTLDNGLLPEGEYDIFAQIKYDGEEMEITRKLLAGEPHLKIVNTDQFFLEKEINDLRIELENQWNKDINSIYADVLVERDGQEIYSGKTISFNLKDHEIKVIKTFLDLTALSVGEADLFITLHYSGKSEESRYKLEIVSPDIFEERIKETQVVTMPGGTFTIIIILIMSLMIFGMFLLMILPLLIRKIKEKIEPPREYLKPNQNSAENQALQKKV